jgi:flavin reductase (DIM6/NTAB) family NADH-FMN oxidoreductase RutF
MPSEREPFNRNTIMAFDSKEQRRIMGMFATGVTVASTRLESETWGMTANAVTSLSLNPPLVLLAIQNDSQSYSKFQSAGCFALNILAREQKVISDRFAYVGPKDFSNLNYKTAVTGSPILLDALAWVDCQLREVLAGGDHGIFIGEIVAGEARQGEPLLYYQGRYATLGG